MSQFSYPLVASLAINGIKLALVGKTSNKYNLLLYNTKLGADKQEMKSRN